MTRMHANPYLLWEKMYQDGMPQRIINCSIQRNFLESFRLDSIVTRFQPRCTERMISFTKISPFFGRVIRLYCSDVEQTEMPPNFVIIRKVGSVWNTLNWTVIGTQFAQVWNSTLEGSRKSPLPCRQNKIPYNRGVIQLSSRNFCANSDFLWSPCVLQNRAIAKG